MSFTSIPNQPIIFNADVAVDCPGCNGDFKQLVDFNDQIFFQLESTSCQEIDMVPFETLLYQWTNDAGIICGDGIIDGLYSQYLYVDFEYQLFSVTFTILNIDQGSLNVKINGSSTINLTLPGTYTLYFNNPTIINDVYIDLIFSSTATFKGCFDASTIKVQGIAAANQIKVGIVDADTLETVDVIAPLFTVKDNKLTVAFDLVDVEVNEGCYRLAIADFCENTCSQFKVNNPLFNLLFGSLYQWTNTVGPDTTFNFAQNLVCFETASGDGEAELISSSDLCEGKYYFISVVVENVSNTAIYAQIGDSSEQFTLGATGYLTVGITAGAPSLSNGMKLVIYIQNTGAGSGEVCISKVNVQIDNSFISWNQYSDVLNIGDFNDDCKYFKIEGCNAEDQFNLAFGGSSFLPAIRLEGRKFRAQYQTEVNNFRYASGKYQTTYVDREKKWTFAFGRLPEYVLDFMSTIFYYDNCYVNGDLYYAIDGEFPDIEYNDADELGALNIDLALKSSKVRKTICSNTDADCLPSILDNSDEPFLLTQEGNRITTEDSVNLYQEYIL
jgi:hypothetical protein